MANWFFFSSYYFQLLFSSYYFFIIFKMSNITKLCKQPNQEVIINYKLQAFLLCVLCKILFFKKIRTLRIKYYFYFADRPTLFFAVLPIDQKINLLLPNSCLKRTELISMYIFLWKNVFSIFSLRVIN